MGVLVGDTNGNGVVNAGDVVANERPLRSDDRCDQLPLDVNDEWQYQRSDVRLVKSNPAASSP